jgi:hypothetical protein
MNFTFSGRERRTAKGFAIEMETSPLDALGCSMALQYKVLHIAASMPPPAAENFS